MNHKRGRPKNRRAGCLLCKPHKGNGAKDAAPMQERRAALALGDYDDEVDFTAFDFDAWLARPLPP